MRLLEGLRLLKHLLHSGSCSTSVVRHLELRHRLEHWHSAIEHAGLHGHTALLLDLRSGAELRHVVRGEGASGGQHRELLVGDVEDAGSGRRERLPSLHGLQRLSVGRDGLPLCVYVLHRRLLHKLS